MPSKKQRRRRVKERRHEFEEAYFDAEGNEITREEYEALAEETGVLAATNGAGATAAASKPIQRGGRTVHPPSVKRVVKRGLLFAPLMYATLYILGRGDGNATTASIAFSTGTLLLFFIPFSYFVDSFMYKRFAARAGAGTKRR
jgi:hypothetical protein